MRIRLSNGQVVGVSTTDINNSSTYNERTQSGNVFGDEEENLLGGKGNNIDGAPSKRQVKNRSGRSGRKQWNGSKSVSSVGGFKDTAAAIYAPTDKPMCVIRSTTHSDGRLRETDRTLLGIRMAEKSYTWEVGGSCSTGYIGGR